MKKMFLIIICFFIVGCSESKEKTVYKKYIKELTSINESNTYPFDINVYFDKLSEEIIYRVIIDNVENEVTNISGIAIHNIKTDDVYPTTGIYDELLNLKKDYVNKDDNYVEGIILVGYIEHTTDEIEVKVLIKYEENNILKTAYYIKRQKLP